MTDEAKPSSGRTIEVWLTEWQAAEDWIEVRVGQRVAWTLTDDVGWLDLLFDGARGVDFVLDTYADADHSPVLVEVSGVVRAVEAVACRHTADGEYVRGSDTATAVHSTLDALPFGALAAIEPTGFILTLELDNA